MTSMLRKVKEPLQIGYNTTDDYLPAEVVEAYTVSKVKAAISNDLLYLRSTYYPCGLWVFTSDPSTPSAGDQIEKEYSATQNRKLIIKEKITNVLRNLHLRSDLLDVLVQFWAPHVTTGGRCFLATSNQPFGITRYHEGLCAFRKLSMEDYRLYVDNPTDTTNDKDFGHIGRTFVQKSPMECLDLQCSSNKEIPQLVQCKIKGFSIVPVLEPSSMDCVGVIEILSAVEKINLALPLFTYVIRKELQGVDLTLNYKDNYYQNPEVASNQESVEELSVEVINSSTEKIFDTNQMETDLATKSPPGTEDLLNGRGMERLQVAMEDDTINNGNGVISATDLVKEGKIKTSKREHRQNETSINYEDLKGFYGMKLEDAAEKLGVSRSTLKRLCRQFEIDRWPSHKRNKVNHPLSDQDPSSSIPPTNQAIHDGRTATIKAAYRDDIIKFQLSFSSRMIDLEEEVRKRLKLEIGTFKIMYVNGDGDRILIDCDAHLNNCLTSFDITTIKMFVEPVTLS